MTSEQRCKNCKHWDAGTPFGGVGQCDLTFAESLPMDDETLAYAFDEMNEVCCVLITKPEFGCVQFEGKE